MKPLMVSALVLSISLFAHMGSGQVVPPSTATKVVSCIEGSNCTHQFIDGAKYKILTTDQVIITVALNGGTKYARATINVTNSSVNQLDVLPAQFFIKETSPKERSFAYVSPEKIVKADASRAGWANAINAFGAGMATQQVTTRTSSNGTVDATGSDGSHISGTYDGTSTSTTSVPDYAAQARARENIRRRREAIAAESQKMATTSLKANSLMPEKSVSGFVYFAFDKKVHDLVLTLPVGGIIYEFPFTLTHQ